MPDRTAAILSQDGKRNIISGVIPRLADLTASDAEATFLCHPKVYQIHKLAREGNHFCGYRNLQMMLLALGQIEHYDQLQTLISIPKLQDMIEHAWTMGYNEHARVQTGGVIGTRKHIGTPEAEAVFQSIGVPCQGRAFSGDHAASDLLDFIAAYFGLTESGVSGVACIDKMPVFLQQPKHSMLVVGITRRRHGRSLLVFDPAIPPPLNSKGQLKSKLLQSITRRLQFRTFERSEKGLGRYSAFETLTIGTSD